MLGVPRITSSPAIQMVLIKTTSFIMAIPSSKSSIHGWITSRLVLCLMILSAACDSSGSAKMMPEACICTKPSTLKVYITSNWRFWCQTCGTHFEKLWRIGRWVKRHHYLDSTCVSLSLQRVEEWSRMCQIHCMWREWIGFWDSDIQSSQNVACSFL